MALTDFEEWTFALDLENFEEIDSLFQSVKQVSDYGMYRTVEGKKPGSYIVTASFMDDSLFLASEKARSAYLEFIENKYCNGEPEEIWYAVEHANAKDD
jgi:hypothetical protein